MLVDHLCLCIPHFTKRCLYGSLSSYAALPKGLRRGIQYGKDMPAGCSKGLIIRQAPEEGIKSQILRYGQQAGLPGGSINLSEGDSKNKKISNKLMYYYLLLSSKNLILFFNASMVFCDSS